MRRVIPSERIESRDPLANAMGVPRLRFASLGMTLLNAYEKEGRTPSSACRAERAARRRAWADEGVRPSSYI